MSVIVVTKDLTGKAVGNTFDFDLTMKSPRWVILTNASPFFVSVDTKDTRTHSLYPGEKNLFALSVATGEIGIALTAELNLSNPPSIALLAEVGDQTEPFPSGIYPVIGSTFVGVGNNVVANQIIQDGIAAPNIVVEATPQGAASSQLKFLNDGSGLFSGGLITFDTAGHITALLEATFNPNLSGGNATLLHWLNSGVGAQHPWSLIYHNDATGSISIEDVGVIPFIAVEFVGDKSGNMSAGQITWDTSGRLSAPRFTFTDRLLWRGTLGGANQFFAELLPTDSKEWDFLMLADGSIEINDQTDGFTALHLLTDKSGNLSNAQIKWDTAGKFSTPSFLTVAGSQESGKCGARYSNCAAGDTVATWVNFKTVMTNTPTSTTITTISTTNASTIGADNIDKNGFRLHWVATAAGVSEVGATYTTVGN